MATSVPQYREGMTVSELLTFTDECLAIIDSLKDLSDLQTLADCLKNFQKLYFHASDHMQVVTDRMVQKNAAKMFADIFEKIFASNPLTSNAIWYVTYYAFQSVWNYSDASFDYAVELANTSLPNTLSSVICNQQYRMTLSSNNNIYYMLKAACSSVHNIVRVPGNAHVFSDRSDLKNSLVELASLKTDAFISCVATLCLAYIVNESERNLLEKGCDSVVFVLDCIKTASENTSNKRRVHGFTVTELLAALAALTVNDSVNKVVLQHDGIPLLKSLCNPAHPEELQFATKILWNLLFDKNNLETIRARQDMEPFFVDLQTRLATMEQVPQGVQKNIEGCLWLLRGSQERPKTARRGSGGAAGEDEASAAPPVFISYNWSNKAKVMRIFSTLKQRHVHCWIDIENMQGSTLDAMAEGIESAKVVLICYSEEYHGSPNCRMEAEYAISKRKKILPLSMQYKFKPSGWLGIILGTKLYYDFSENKSDFDTVFSGFYVALKKMMNEGAAKVEETPIRSETAQSVESFAEPTPRNKRSQNHGSRQTGKSTGVRPEVAQWSAEEVTRWLKEHGLGAAELSHFNGMTGRMFSRFISTKCEAPEYFYRVLDEKLCLNLVAAMTLCDAVEESLMMPEMN